MDLDYIKSVYGSHILTNDEKKIKPSEDDKFILSPDKKMCCIVYAIEEVKMGWCYSKIAIVKQNAFEVSFNTLEGWFLEPSVQELWLNNSFFYLRSYAGYLMKKFHYFGATFVDAENLRYIDFVEGKFFPDLAKSFNQFSVVKSFFEKNKKWATEPIKFEKVSVLQLPNIH